MLVLAMEFSRDIAVAQRTPPARGAGGVMGTAGSKEITPSKRNRRVRRLLPSPERMNPTTGFELETPSSAYIDWESASRCG